MKKQCTKCQRVLALSEFCKDETRKDGLYPQCKGCVLKYQKERDAALKLEAINAFGGRCVHMENGVQCLKNSIGDLKELHLSHPNDDGDKHRDLISKGRGGRYFYEALKDRGYGTDGFDVQVMCISHHMSLDLSGKKSHNYKEGKFNDPIWLRERYVGDRMTAQEIATLCGVSFQTILRRLIKFNIQRRRACRRP